MRVLFCLVFTLGEVPAIHELQELQQPHAGGRDETDWEPALREHQGQCLRRGREDDLLSALSTSWESHRQEKLTEDM